MFTLADARNLSQDKLTQFVINEYRKSPLLDAMIFDDTVKPQGGQSLAYTYNRVTTLSSAGGRALGSEYAAQEAKTTQVTVNLVPFGGSFQIDRVIAQYERQLVDHIQFQMSQKLESTREVFSDWFINGDSGSDPTQFDGLDKALTGSSTERDAGDSLDLSSAVNIKANWTDLLYDIRMAIAPLNKQPTIICVNREMFGVFQIVASHANQFTQSASEFGGEIVKYGAATIMAMGDKPGTSTPIIPTVDGRTDIYFVHIGLDGVHGVTTDGQREPKIYLPDMTQPGAVKKGEVEMVAAMAVKSTRAAGVLRGVKIAPTA
jgi:hypothetical protein